MHRLCKSSPELCARHSADAARRAMTLQQPCMPACSLHRLKSLRIPVPATEAAAPGAGGW